MMYSALCMSLLPPTLQKHFFVIFVCFAFNLVCNNNILDILFVLSVVISTSVKLESEDKLPLISNFIVDAIPKNCNVVILFFIFVLVLLHSLEALSCCHEI